MVRIAYAPLSACAVFLAALHASAVGGEIRVQASGNEVRVEARDATGADILAALAGHFAISYRGVAPTERRVTGTFEGRLSQVVKRVLEGYSYVINRTSHGLEVVIVSPEGITAVPPPRPIPRGRQE